MNPPSSAIDSIREKIERHVVSENVFRGETSFAVRAASVVECCRTLRDELGFSYLADLTAVDYLTVRLPRYEVVYLVHRFGEDCEENLRIRLKVGIGESDPSVDSVTPVWAGADWLEREAYDMFGITFNGHPDPRRILMPEDYDGFPLRKDFDVRNREPSKRSFERALERGSG